MIIPQKLQKGDTIRIIAPARSISLPFIQAIRKDAQKRLEGYGLTVTYGKHVEEMDDFASSSIEHRIEDLHDAFSDPEVKAIFTVIGGFNSNQLLKYIDYGLIKKHPKILCGFSDITALGHAIYAKTDMITYSGPHFFSFGELKNFEYSEEYVMKCLFNNKPFDVAPSKQWSNDRWAGSEETQNNRNFFENEGYWVINNPEKNSTAEGRLIGANQNTFLLLSGTEFWPGIKDSILFLEEDDWTGELTDVEFDRDLQSILHQKDSETIRGIVIGRFQPTTKVTREKLEKIIASKKELQNIPIIANVDFGHTDPLITFPIGGTVRISIKGDTPQITILEH